MTASAPQVQKRRDHTVQALAFCSTPTTCIRRLCSLVRCLSMLCSVRYHNTCLQELGTWTLLGEVCGAVTTESDLADQCCLGENASKIWLMDQTAAGRTGAYHCLCSACILGKPTTDISELAWDADRLRMSTRAAGRPTQVICTTLCIYPAAFRKEA